MSIKYLAAPLLLIAGYAHAGDVEVEQYTYQTQLDIAQVLRTEVAPSPICKVTDAVLTYRDSAGELRKLGYRTLSEACKSEN
ncbi:DUF2790 domain-containing protein [Stutzerimonas nitrititolerans]|uniref:DUF2790 domain-containing protein n=1 Tax=Stutzerimonas nitrititolerans TaxID=2482751 RepID=UPI0028A02184|nr:DUF2790 domain-containing protein [Stutzerimonas nitrititolerans]